MDHKGKSLVVSGVNDEGIQTLINGINKMLDNYGKTVDVEKKSKGFFERLGDTLQYLIWFVVVSIIVIIAIKTVLK